MKLILKMEHILKNTRLNMVLIFKSILLLLVMSIQAQMHVNDTSEIEIEYSKVLSRRKRFLIFPEGSSFQLVFCVTYPMLIPIGDIFLYGNTVALAWELPQDPYSPFNHRADPLHRRIDTKVYYTDEDGRIIDKQPYHRKPIVNPAFVKRSVDELHKKGTLQQFRIDRQQMHASENKREYLKSMEQRSIEFHRSSRASLYQKIETLLHGLGVNGQECVMKSLCLIGQAKERPQGVFFQEIIYAVFTLPSSPVEDEYSDYDTAHAATESCEALYPECSEQLVNPELGRWPY